MDFPTHVGMARLKLDIVFVFPRFPHPRGDGPWWRDHPAMGGKISPPTWGWPVYLRDSSLLMADFPTHVGMARLGALALVLAR